MLDLLIDTIDGVWMDVSRLLHRIDDEDWDRPTGCPGWTVKDQLSHMVWSAGVYAGRDVPAVELPELAHVTNPQAAYMELAVHVRRPMPGAAVLVDFDHVRAEAVAVMRRSQPDEPIGEVMGRAVTVGSFLPITVFDQWLHGEDIRAALGIAPDLGGPAADHALALIQRHLVARVARSAKITTTGPGARELVLGLGAPEVEIMLPTVDLVSLAAGRDRPRSAPIVVGDEAAVDAIFAVFPMTP